jgi:hypothetical protein
MLLYILHLPRIFVLGKLTWDAGRSRQFPSYRVQVLSQQEVKSKALHVSDP